MCLHICPSIFERLRRPRESRRDYPYSPAYKCFILEILCYLPAENNKTVKKSYIKDDKYLLPGLLALGLMHSGRGAVGELSSVPEPG